MPTWPPSLPDALLQQGYQESPPNNLLRTQMDSGPPKVRRRSRAGSRPISGALALSAEQLETLDAFYVDTLEDGALPFDWRHPRTGLAVSCRFAEQPKYSPAGGTTWRASISLEVLP